jgi:hypothetical protein
LTREQIATWLGVTPTYLSRIFRQQSGLALWEHVNAYRVARACELLEHSDLTVTEVAFMVGFNDPAYFSRVFRKQRPANRLRYIAPRPEQAGLIVHSVSNCPGRVSNCTRRGTLIPVYCDTHNQAKSPL